MTPGHLNHDAVERSKRTRAISRRGFHINEIDGARQELADPRKESQERAESPLADRIRVDGLQVRTVAGGVEDSFERPAIEMPVQILQARGDCRQFAGARTGMTGDMRKYENPGDERRPKEVDPRHRCHARKVTRKRTAPRREEGEQMTARSQYAPELRKGDVRPVEVLEDVFAQAHVERAVVERKASRVSLREAEARRALNRRCGFPHQPAIEIHAKERAIRSRSVGGGSRSCAATDVENPETTFRCTEETLVKLPCARCSRVLPWKIFGKFGVVQPVAARTDQLSHRAAHDAPKTE